MAQCCPHTLASLSRFIVYHSFVFISKTHTLKARAQCNIIALISEGIAPNAQHSFNIHFTQKAIQCEYCTNMFRRKEQSHFINSMQRLVRAAILRGLIKTHCSGTSVKQSILCTYQKKHNNSYVLEPTIGRKRSE